MQFNGTINKTCTNMTLLQKLRAAGFLIQISERGENGPSTYLLSIATCQLINSVLNKTLKPYVITSVVFKAVMCAYLERNKTL